MLKYVLILSVVSYLIFGLWFPSNIMVTDQIETARPGVMLKGAPPSMGEMTSHMINTLPQALMNSSLKGTTIDGLYPVDDSGYLILNESIKNRFEYFLSTMGEFSVDDVKNMVADDINLNLQEPARSQAHQLFNDYIGYKYALADLEQSLQTPQDYEIGDLTHMRFQIQQLRDKRREYFNQETVDAFFGFDEVYDDFMLTRLEIQSNNQLTDNEKQAQIDSLEQTLPVNIQQMRAETEKVGRVFQLSEKMKTQGASEEDIYQLNTQEFGQEAAQRLQEVDRKRSQWENKVNQFIANKYAIFNDESQSESEKQNALNDLLTEFDDHERKRLKAYELMKTE
ncbi:hypothetical protein NBRC116188_29260 [Oceaniserpentilla sp. 4NH20-0058]|uniref:lipase secretion chaperone n=1 Tax=Oceaniserpentilla sp. 4NH20-0058 TaxID=3127660 RepID=UPI003104CE11